MTQFVGLDVSQKDTAVSVVDEEGRQMWRGKVKTDPTAIADVILSRAPDAKRIGFETGRSRPGSGMH
ncbi:hypothetical protein [Sphingomonas sp. Ant20]|uniref:hypothetical protein n=1 Tax=Sphingomonas sp. Ant20 TaxID=104605 RepID=UPI000B2BC3F2|nr:hypothetical protein [Sphingomonas sp. Ant20]